MSIAIEWLVGRKEANRESFKELVVNQLNHDPIMDRLRQMVEARFDAALEGRVEKGMDDPNWAIKRAALDGKVEAYREILNLIKVVD